MKKIKPRKIRLGVNLDHVATLRQVRGASTVYPDLLTAAFLCKKAGAHQITIHLREDRRHIQLSDVQKFSRLCPLPVNLEMGATDEMVDIACKYKPQWVCLVPEKREELTTEGGLNVEARVKVFKKIISRLKSKGIKTSTFIEPDLAQVKASFEAGAKAIEFHTGHWVHLTGQAERKEWARLMAASRYAHSLGLNVHAGHGLDYDSTRRLLKLPHLEEVNIGHFLICESVYCGLEVAVQKMLGVLAGKSKTKTLSVGS